MEPNDVHDPKPIVSTVTREVDLLHPTADMIDLQEMSLSLSREYRYNNLSDRQISVLSHLLICDRLAETRGIQDPAVRLLILLHDAHEYILGDTCRPLKKALNAASNGALSDLEHRLDKAIFRKFGLPPEMAYDSHPARAIVKEIDTLALAHEVNIVFPQVLNRWGSLPAIDQDENRKLAITFMNSEDTASVFWAIRDYERQIIKWSAFMQVTEEAEQTSTTEWRGYYHETR